MNDKLSSNHLTDEQSRLLSAEIRIRDAVNMVFFLFAMMMAILMGYLCVQAPFDTVGLLIALTLLVLTVIPIALNTRYLIRK